MDKSDLPITASTMKFPPLLFKQYRGKPSGPGPDCSESFAVLQTYTKEQCNINIDREYTSHPSSLHIQPFYTGLHLNFSITSNSPLQRYLLSDNFSSSSNFMNSSLLRVITFKFPVLSVSQLVSLISLIFLSNFIFIFLGNFLLSHFFGSIIKYILNNFSRVSQEYFNLSLISIFLVSSIQLSLLRKFSQFFQSLFAQYLQEG